MKNLRWNEYSKGKLRLPKSREAEIKELVNREAEILVEIPQQPLPRYEKQIMKFSEVSKRAFASCVGMFSI